MKEFEKEKEKESDFKNSLTSYMKTFTEEFTVYSHGFLQSFKTNSKQSYNEED